MSKPHLAYLTSLTGYFGLLFLIMGSIAWSPTDNHPPRTILLIVLAGPLLFPLRGLLHGRTYTHAWAGFMALVYFVIAVAVAAGSESFLIGTIEALLSVIWFIGSLLYVRWKSRAIAQQH